MFVHMSHGSELSPENKEYECDSMYLQYYVSQNVASGNNA